MAALLKYCNFLSHSLRQQKKKTHLFCQITASKQIYLKLIFFSLFLFLNIFFNLNNFYFKTK